MDWLMWFIAYASTPVAILVVFSAFLLTVSGLIWLNGKLIMHMLDHFNALMIFASFVRNRKDFKQYLKDRKAREEGQRKKRDQYWHTLKKGEQT